MRLQVQYPARRRQLAAARQQRGQRLHRRRLVAVTRAAPGRSVLHAGPAERRGSVHPSRARHLRVALQARRCDAPRGQAHDRRPPLGAPARTRRDSPQRFVRSRADATRRPRSDRSAPDGRRAGPCARARPVGHRQPLRHAGQARRRSASASRSPRTGATFSSGRGSAWSSSTALHGSEWAPRATPTGGASAAAGEPSRRARRSPTRRRRRAEPDPARRGRRPVAQEAQGQGPREAPDRVRPRQQEGPAARRRRRRPARSSADEQPRVVGDHAGHAERLSARDARRSSTVQT